MNDILELIKSFAKKNIKVFLATIIVIFILLLVLLPYIDANFLIFNRLSQRIDILDKVSRLDYEEIRQNPILKNEYDSILNGIENIQNKSISFVDAKEKSVDYYYIKYISGGLLFWVIGLALIFQKDKDKTAKLSRRLFNRFASVAICILLGFVCASIAAIIPTIGNVWANAILFPCALLTVVGLFIYGLPKNSK